jgi:hypothetical protein
MFLIQLLQGTTKRRVRLHVALARKLGDARRKAILSNPQLLRRHPSPPAFRTGHHHHISTRLTAGGHRFGAGCPVLQCCRVQETGGPISFLRRHNFFLRLVVLLLMLLGLVRHLLVERLVQNRGQADPARAQLQRDFALCAGQVAAACSWIERALSGGDR